MPKRISLNESDAAHAYEWLVMYWTGDKAEAGQKFGGCAQCQRLGKRLERAIGPKEAARVRRVVAKSKK